MPSLCGGRPVWDSQLFWQPQGPNLTPCFKHLLLPLLPGAVLLLLAPIELVGWRRRSKLEPAGSYLWLGKVLAVVGLVISQLAEVGVTTPATSHWWVGAAGEVAAYTAFGVLLGLSRRWVTLSQCVASREMAATIALSYGTELCCPSVPCHAPLVP